MTTAKNQAQKNPWPPPEREDFDHRLDKALTGTDNEEYRKNIGAHCWVLMDRAWYRRTHAVSARALWNPFRYAAAVIPVVAAGAGGSLVSHVHGTAGTVIGWVALIGGLLGAAINSLRPGVEYGVDLTKAAQFEHLYWDIHNYAIAKLPIDKPTAIAAALDSFARRMEEISVLSGSTTVTSS